MPPHRLRLFLTATTTLSFSTFFYKKLNQTSTALCNESTPSTTTFNNKAKYPTAGYPFLNVGCTLNPMYEKRYKQGEDAYVVAQGNFEDWRTAGQETFVCVMDGVGGWKRRLVDAGKFTKEMAKHVKEIYINEYTGYPGKEHTEGSQIHTLKDVLDHASKRTNLQGSTTCVMAEALPYNGKWPEDDVLIKTCNLGDSGYMILRPYKLSVVSDQAYLRIVYKSEYQRHRFNAPYQTGSHHTWPTKAYST